MKVPCDPFLAWVHSVPVLGVEGVSLGVFLKSQTPLGHLFGFAKDAFKQRHLIGFLYRDRLLGFWKALKL